MGSKLFVTQSERDLGTGASYEIFDRSNGSIRHAQNDSVVYEIECVQNGKHKASSILAVRPGRPKG
jgi:hypothetical protein